MADSATRTRGGGMRPSVRSSVASVGSAASDSNGVADQLGANLADDFRRGRRRHRVRSDDSGPVEGSVRPTTPTATVRRALLVVNVQNDHFADGSFPIPHAADVVPVINNLRAREWDLVVFVKTEHSVNHSAFCSNNPGALLHEVTPLKAATGVGPQTMWSDYFVACTTGAELHPQLRVEPQDIVLATGHNPHADSYSAFGPLKDDLTSSPLYSILKDANVDQLFVCGLASDYSVQYTVLDAKMVLPETKVFVVEDACRGVTAAGIQDAFRKFSMERVAVCDSKTEPISKFPVYQPPLKKYMSARDLNVTAKHFRFDEELDDLAASVGMTTGGTTKSASFRKRQAESSSSRRHLESDGKGEEGGTKRSDSPDRSSLAGQIDGLLGFSDHSSDGGDDDDGMRESKRRPPLRPSQASARSDNTVGRQFLSDELVLSVAAQDYKRVAALLKREDILWIINAKMEPLGMAALHMAAQIGDEQMVKLLLDAGAFPNVLSMDASTPLLLAIKAGAHAATRLLLAHEDISITLADNVQGLTPLMAACRLGDVAMVNAVLAKARRSPSLNVRDYIEARSAFGMTAVMFACAAANPNNLSVARPWTPILDTAEGSGSGTRTGRRGSRLNANNRRSTITGNVRLVRSDIMDRCSRVLSALLKSCLEPMRRVRWMREQDVDGWSALHYAARTGLLSRIEWSIFEAQINRIPVNLQTTNGLTMLHIAVWNSKAPSVAVLLGEWPDRPNPWRSRVRLNQLLQVRGHSELDLAIMRGQLDSSRLVIRGGGYAKVFAGAGCDKLLHKLVLIGDAIAVELLLRNPFNHALVTKPLILMVRNMKYPATCTFTFAAYHNPTVQHIYECVVCNQRVCLLCASLCHAEHPWKHTLRHEHKLRYIGEVESYCACRKDKCQALAVVDMREAAGYKYVPNPLRPDPSLVEFEAPATPASSATQGTNEGSTASRRRLTDMGYLASMLARNSHEVWAVERMSQGWRYGPVRDDKRKHHPSLFPYRLVNKENRLNDLEAAKQAILVVRATGYIIVRNKYMSPRGRQRKGSTFGALSDNEGINASMSSMASDSTNGTRREQRIATHWFDQDEEVVEDGVIGDVPDMTEEERMALINSFVPRPVDTSRVQLRPELKGLVELLARNQHEVWAEGKMQEGYTYAPFRIQSETLGDKSMGRAQPKRKRIAQELNNLATLLEDDFSESDSSDMSDGTTEDDEDDEVKCSPMLVPFRFLTEKEKAFSRKSAMEMVKTMLMLGFDFQLEEGRKATAPAKLSRKLSERQFNNLQKRNEQLLFFKQGVYNAFLFSVATNSQTGHLDILLKSPHRRHRGAQINCVDEMGRTPVYLAVQHGHQDMAKALIDYGASLQLADLNGITPLAIAAFQGNVAMMETLIDHGANYVQRDRLGLTPIHYAAYAGNLAVVELVGKKLVRPGRPGLNFQHETFEDATPSGRLRRMVNVLVQQLGRSGMSRTPGSQFIMQLAHMPPSRRADIDDTMLQLTAVAAEFMWDVLTPPEQDDLHSFANGHPTANVVAATRRTRKEDPLRKLTAGGIIPRLSRGPSVKNGLIGDLDDYGMWHMGGTGQNRASQRNLLDNEKQPRHSRARRPGSELTLTPRSGTKSATPVAMDGSPLSWLRRQSAANAAASPTKLASPTQLDHSSTRDLDASADESPSSGNRGRARSEAVLPSASTLAMAKLKAAGSRRFSDVAAKPSGSQDTIDTDGATDAATATPGITVPGTPTSTSKPGAEGATRPTVITSPDSSTSQTTPGQRRRRNRPNIRLNLAATGSDGDSSPRSVGLSKDPSPPGPAMKKQELEAAARLADLEFRRRVGAALRDRFARLTPLTLAVHARQYEVVELLLQLGADPNYVDGSGLSAYDRSLSAHADAQRTLQDMVAARHQRHAQADKIRAEKSASIVRAMSRAVRAQARKLSGTGPSTGASTGAESSQNTSRLGKMLVPPWARKSTKTPRVAGTGSPGSLVNPVDSRQLASSLKRRSKALGIALPPSKKVEAGPRSKWELVRSRLQRHGGSGEQMRQLKRKTSQRKFNAFAAGGGRGNDSDGDDAAFALEDRAEEARKRMERSTARQERLLELQLEDAIHNADGASQMVDVLNASRAVKKRRRNFSFRTLANQLVAYLVMVALLVVFTPIAWDHATPTYAKYRQDLVDALDSSFSPVVTSGDEWWDWMDRNILLQPPQGNFTTAQLLPCTVPAGIASLGDPMPIVEPYDSMNLCTTGVARVLEENLVAGGIRVAVGRRAVRSCPSVSFIANAPADCLARDDEADREAEDNELTWTMSSADVEARRELVHPHRSGGPGVPWISRVSRYVRVDVTIYNPNLALLVAVSFVTKFSSQGTIHSKVEFSSVNVNNGRFPPSELFALAFAVILLVQLASIAREYRRAGWRRFISSGWVWVDVASAAICIAIIVYDIVALQRLWDLELNLADYHTFVNVAPLFHLILQTGDLVAVMILLMAARVIKYLRVFPYWGPMVVAVIMTWLDPSVILYLIVAVGLTAAMAVAFLVAFGTQVLEYSTIPESVFTLFTMSFAEEWHQVEGATFRALNTIFFLFYVVFAVVLLNLFIGIVTDVYPKARQKSQQEWENLITDLMQEEISRRKANLSQPAGGSLLGRIFPCALCQRWCVSRDYRLRMAKYEEDVRAGRVVKPTDTEVPTYLTQSKRLLNGIAPRRATLLASPRGPAGTVVPFGATAAGKVLASPRLPRAAPTPLLRGASVNSALGVSKKDARRPPMLSAIGKSRSDFGVRPDVGRQSSMRDLIKSYEKRRRHAKRCTTCGMCGCRLKCCACWAYTWQCRWLPTRLQPAAAAPPLPSPRRRGSFNFHARQQAARQSPPPPKPSCCTRTARGCGRRLRACLWFLTCGMCGGVGGARGSTSAEAAAAGKSSSSRPPTVLQWDAGVSTFSALQQLVTTMVTTSVPDASGKDVDARAGKSSTDQSTPQADLYSTHLNLGARRNEGQAPRRGSTATRRSRKTNGGPSGSFRVFHSLGRMTSGSRARGRRSSGAALGSRVPSFGSEGAASNRASDIHSSLQEYQVQMSDRMGSLEASLHELKVMLASSGQRHNTHHHHHRRTSNNSVAHSVHPSAAPGLGVDTFPSSHSLESAAVRDRRGRRGLASRGEPRPKSRSLHIDTASVLGMDGATARSPVPSSSSRRGGLRRRASYGANADKTITPKRSRKDLLGSRSVMGTGTSPPTIKASMDRLNRSHEITLGL